MSETTKRCKDWCGTPDPGAYRGQVRWCTGECRDNRRRMHEGEDGSRVRHHDLCNSRKGGLCDCGPTYTAPAPAVEGEPPERGAAYTAWAGPAVCRRDKGHGGSHHGSPRSDRQPAGEPPEMTFAEAMALDPKDVEVQLVGIATWESLAHWPNVFVSTLRAARFRRKPQPAPALTRMRVLAEEFAAGTDRISMNCYVDFGGRVATAFGTRLLQLIDGPAVDALRRALEQAEREFLGPGEGSR